MRNEGFDFARTQGLVRALSMSADQLAARKGEDNLLVQIKRNRERLDACSCHEFEPDPEWHRRPGSLLRSKVRCRHCGGEMESGEAHTYLRGLAHGSGQDYRALVATVWPPAKEV